MIKRAGLFRFVLALGICSLAAEAAPPPPSFLDPLPDLGAKLGGRTDSRFALGVEVVNDVPFTPPEEDPLWQFRVLAGAGTSNHLNKILFEGDVNVLDDHFYGVTGGRVLWRDPWCIPVDVSLNLGALYHPGTKGVDDAFQFLLYFNIEWTDFPWNDHLRTRIGVAEGLSYLTKITYSEMVVQGYPDSEHFLNYLEVSLSLNLADLLTLTRANKLFPGDDVSGLDDAYLTASIHHRSGIGELFGTVTDLDGDEEGVREASNFLSIGVTMHF